MKKQRNTLQVKMLVTPVMFWIGCATQAEEIPHADKVIVKTAQVEHKEFALPIHTSGKLSSKAEKKLSFKIGGIVENIFVDEGQMVKKGRLLARLDLAEIDAQVTQARSAFEKSKRDLERVEKLYADKVATLEQLQDTNTAFEIANSNLKIAEFNLHHSEIYAPVDGKILKRFVETNELISPGAPVFIFASAGRDWIVRAGVTDRDIIRLKLADSASVSFDAYPEKRFPARVSEIAESADPMSGTYEVELNIYQKTIVLKSGFISSVDIYPSQKQHFSMIPIEALIDGDGKHGFVYKLESSMDIARKVPVKIGHIFDDRIAVISGLEDVEEVVTDGAPYLTEGAIVKLIK